MGARKNKPETVKNANSRKKIVTKSMKAKAKIVVKKPLKNNNSESSVKAKEKLTKTKASEIVSPNPSKGKKQSSNVDKGDSKGKGSRGRGSAVSSGRGRGTDVTVVRGRGGSRGRASNRGTGIPNVRGQGGSSSRGRGASIARGRVEKLGGHTPRGRGGRRGTKNVQFQEPDVENNLVHMNIPSLNGSQLNVEPVVDNNQPDPYDPFSEQSIREDQLKLQTIVNDKLVQKRKKIIKGNQLEINTSKNKVLDLVPADQAIGDNLLNTPENKLAERKNKPETVKNVNSRKKIVTKSIKAKAKIVVKKPLKNNNSDSSANAKEKLTKTKASEIVSPNPSKEKKQSINVDKGDSKGKGSRGRGSAVSKGRGRGTAVTVGRGRGVSRGRASSRGTGIPSVRGQGGMNIRGTSRGRGRGGSNARGRGASNARGRVEKLGGHTPRGRGGRRGTKNVQFQEPDVENNLVHINIPSLNGSQLNVEPVVDNNQPDPYDPFSEQSIREDQLKLETIVNDKLVQKGEKIIKGNQLAIYASKNEVVGLVPADQAIGGNLLNTQEDKLAMSVVDENESELLKSSKNWALVKSTIMKNTDQYESNKTLYKWNKCLYKDNMEMSAIVQLNYDDQRKLRGENSKLRSSLATCEEKIQKLEQMNKSLWQELDKKSLESEVRYNSKNQQYLLKKNFKDLTEKVKSECDEKCKKLERELISVSKENEHLVKKYEKLKDTPQKRFPKKVRDKNNLQTAPSTDKILDADDAETTSKLNNRALLEAHEHSLTSFNDVDGGAELEIRSSAAVEEICISDSENDDCVIVGEPTDSTNSRPDNEKVFQSEPIIPPWEIEISSSEENHKTILERPNVLANQVGVIDTTDDSNDEIFVRSETSISIEGNVSSEDESYHKETPWRSNLALCIMPKSETVESKEIKSNTLVKQDILMEDHAQAKFPVQPKPEITSNENQNESIMLTSNNQTRMTISEPQKNPAVQVKYQLPTVSTISTSVPKVNQIPENVQFKIVPAKWSIVAGTLSPPKTLKANTNSPIPGIRQSVRSRIAANPTEIVAVHQAAPCQKLKIEQQILEKANKRNQLSAVQSFKPGMGQRLKTLSSSSSSEADDEEMSSPSPPDVKPVLADINISPDIKPNVRKNAPDPEAGMYVHPTKQRVSRVQNVSPAYANNLKLVTARTSEQLKGKSQINVQPNKQTSSADIKPKLRKIRRHNPPSKRVKTETPNDNVDSSKQTQIQPSILNEPFVPCTTLQQNDPQAWMMMQNMCIQMMNMQNSLRAFTAQGGMAVQPGGMAAQPVDIAAQFGGLAAQSGGMGDMQMFNAMFPSGFGNLSTPNFPNQIHPVLNAGTLPIPPAIKLNVPTSTINVTPGVNPGSTHVSNLTTHPVASGNTGNLTMDFNRSSEVVSIPSKETVISENGVNMNLQVPSHSGTVSNISKDTVESVYTAVPKLSDDTVHVENNALLNRRAESVVPGTISKIDSSKAVVSNKSTVSVPPNNETTLRSASMPVLLEETESSDTNTSPEDNVLRGCLDGDLFLSNDSSEEDELSIPSSPTPEQPYILSEPLNKWANINQGTCTGESLLFLNTLIGKEKSELAKYLNGTARCAELEYPNTLPPVTGLARATYNFVISDEQNIESGTSERDLPLSYPAQKILTVIQVLARSDAYSDLPLLAIEFFNTQIISNRYNSLQAGQENINLVRLGRFYGALSRQFDLVEEIKGVIFNALYWRPVYAFSLTYGILCLHSDIFSGLPYENFGLTERSMIYALACPPHFNDAKHFRHVQSLLKQSLNLMIPELTYEQFVDTLLEEMKGLEEDNILKKAAKAVSMLCMQMNLMCFEQFIITRITRWVVDWQHNNITDAVLAGFINVIGTVGYDSPKQGDINGLKTIVSKLKSINIDIMGPILKEAIFSSYSKIEEKIRVKESTIPKNNTGRIKKKKKKNKRKRPFMDKRQREMVKVAAELHSLNKI